jgi:hypothetical protein
MQRRTLLSTLASATGNGIVLLKAKSVWAQGSDVGVSLIPNRGDTTRQLRFVLTLSNPQTKTLFDQVLWMYVPIKHGAAQDVVSVDTQVKHSVDTDILRHSILKIQLAELPPLAQRVFSLTVNVTVYSTPRQIKLSVSENWLEAEAYTEVGDNRIQALALQLRGEIPWQAARNIYDWVVSNIAYAGYIADDLGALYALTEKKGDCTEYAFLVVALARASQIPARMVGGYVIDRNSAPRADEYHNWAELYLEGAWRIVDAQKQNWLQPCDQYVAFRYFRGVAINNIGLAHRYKVAGDMQVRM